MLRFFQTCLMRLLVKKICCHFCITIGKLYFQWKLWHNKVNMFTPLSVTLSIVMWECGVRSVCDMTLTGSDLCNLSKKNSASQNTNYNAEWIVNPFQLICHPKRGRDTPPISLLRNQLQKSFFPLSCLHTLCIKDFPWLFSTWFARQIWIPDEAYVETL